MEEKKNGRSNGNSSAGGGACSCAAGDGCNCAHGCGCRCGGHGHHWTFFLLRTLLTILILMVAFWFGVAASRIGSYGWSRDGMMYGRYYYPSAYGSGGIAAPMIPANGTSTPANGPGGAY